MSTVRAMRAVPVIAILAAALLLRLYPLLTSVYIWDEEREWIAVAESISLSPGRVHLPVHDGHHPSLPAYLFRAGSLLAGRNPFGYRLASLVCGLLTVFLLWRLGRRWAGPAVGLWAAFLLAFNEYHAGISVFAVEKSLQHVMAAVCLWGLYRYLTEGRPRMLSIALLASALAVWANFRSVLLAGVCLAALVLARGWRSLLRPEVVRAFALFALALSPLLIAETQAQPGGMRVGLREHLSRLGTPGFNRHYLLFFGRDAVAEVYRWRGQRLVDPAEEYPAMNMAFGALALAAAGAALARFGRQDPGGRLFLALFWLVFLFFSFIRPNWALPHLDPKAWFWVDLTLPAAVLLAGKLLADQAGWRKQLLMVLVGLAALQSVHSTFWK